MSESLSPILGIHHVTAIARDPQANVEFYSGTLGLRMVKKTVNFDDPSTYHLYYGDGVGSPGSIMTFFPWPGARSGTLGAGQTRTTSFAVPEDSLDFWRQHLHESLVKTEPVKTEEVERFGTPALTFADPDGLRLELVATVQDDDEREPWDGSGVPAEHAICGFDGVTLLLSRLEPTVALLTGPMGFRQVAEDGRRVRFETGDGGSHTRVDLLHDPDAAPGRVAAGSIHHVAFRLADDEAQAAWQEHLFEHGQPTTEVKDRQYFHSIYYREPGGVLFELATDNPGFAVDETVEELGTGLQLPPWYEEIRDRIEAALPPLSMARKAA